MMCTILTYTVQSTLKCMHCVRMRSRKWHHSDRGALRWTFFAFVRSKQHPGIQHHASRSQRVRTTIGCTDTDDALVSPTTTSTSTSTNATRHSIHCADLLLHAQRGAPTRIALEFINRLSAECLRMACAPSSSMYSAVADPRNGAIFARRLRHPFCSNIEWPAFALFIKCCVPLSYADVVHVN